VHPSQLSPEIPVDLALPPALFFQLLLPFLLTGFFPLLVFGSGFAQHMGKSAAYVPVTLPRRVIMLLAELLPRNPRQALPDFVLVQFLRLPPCGSA
jgi:hypothetical protein